MYVTNANSVYALDSGTGRLIWRYSDTGAKRQGNNRGAAILGDRVYFTSNDNYLTALDRKSGAVIFNKKFGDVSEGINRHCSGVYWPRTGFWSATPAATAESAFHRGALGFHGRGTVADVHYPGQG